MNTRKNSHFLQQVAVEQIISMFDLLPGVLFWVKDESHKFIHANQAFIAHQEVKGIAQIIGKSDFDFAPAHLAKQYIRDDNKIISGQTVTDRLEMNMTQTGDTAWYVTSKRPLLSKTGEIIGSYGVTRHLQKQAMALSGFEAIKAPVDFIRAHYHSQFSIEQLANVAHLSISALERRFKKYLDKTPKKFINEVRLENARRLLIESNMPISQVGDKVGFTDHSYFSKQFRLLFGELPSEFRKNNQTPM
jgi:AraC-like DNA-binding protein